jgi:hypothetical protein
MACLGAAALVNASPPALGVHATDPCPAAYPEDELTVDQSVNGLTVTQGTEPSEFTGKVLGVLDDGIAPGVDMIMMDLTSPTIDKVGIWQGMSGSPVYAEDGRLIGAVAYGLAFGPSTVAGITPFGDMQALLDQAPASAKTRTTLADAKRAVRVDISSKQARQLARHTDVSAKNLDQGLERLPMPFVVSGNAHRLNQAAHKLGMKGVRAFQGHTAAANSTPSVIEAGGNLAATVSYGDLTSGGVGTATAVCDNGQHVLAFGHPMLWTGPTSLTMHGADAVYIQDDPTSAGFKVANLTAPAGTIVADRLTGLLGLDNTLPDTTRVTAHVEKIGGGSRDGTTIISVPDAVPEISALHLLTDEDRVFDQLTPGSAQVTWTVRGKRSDGTPFHYTRTNRYASEYDLTYETIFESYDQLYRLMHNKFDDVTITHISYTSTLNPDFKAYKLGSVERRVNGQWEKLSRTTVRVQGGSTMHLRAHLRPLGDGTAKVVPLTLHVPQVKRSTYGFLQVTGGAWVFERPTGSSFGQFLHSLSHATHNNDVVGQVSVRTNGSNHVSKGTGSVDQVVQGQLGTSLRIIH